MIIYNLTIKLEPGIAAEYLAWLNDTHIAEVIGTGCFESAQVLRLLDVDDSDGPTYVLQFRADSKADYNRYCELFAPEMRQRSFLKWGNRFIAFRSVLQIVD